MRGAVILGAVIAAAVGAAAWKALTLVHRASFAPWAIGALVGFVAVKLRGRGKSTGVVCAVLTLLSVLSGKYSVDATRRDEMLRKWYQVLPRDSEDFARLKSPEEYPQFMMTHGYTGAKKPSDVTPEEKTVFLEESVPILEDFQRNRPDFFQWKEQWLKDSNLVGDFARNFGLPEIIFTLLGIVSAYLICACRGEAGQGAG